MTQQAVLRSLILLLVAVALTTATDASAQGRTSRAAAPASKDATSKPSVPEAERAAAGDSERGVSAPSGDADKSAQAAEVQESEEGVKTYKFGTIEVEGRLKAPQILYFLRRVRAEFEAGLLGHRSFLGELSDTRRHPALNQ
jgi:hypothetical protein